MKLICAKKGVLKGGKGADKKVHGKCEVTARALVLQARGGVLQGRRRGGTKKGGAKVMGA